MPFKIRDKTGCQRYSHSSRSLARVHRLLHRRPARMPRVLKGCVLRGSAWIWWGPWCKMVLAPAQGSGHMVPKSWGWVMFPWPKEPPCIWEVPSVLGLSMHKGQCSQGRGCLLFWRAVPGPVWLFPCLHPLPGAQGQNTAKCREHKKALRCVPCCKFLNQSHRWAREEKLKVWVAPESPLPNRTLAWQEHGSRRLVESLAFSPLQTRNKFLFPPPLFWDC